MPHMQQWEQLPMLPLELYYSATAWEAAVRTKQVQLRDSAQVYLSNHSLAEPH